MKNTDISTKPKTGQPVSSLWLTALFCCMLWGLAPALIKSGYAVMDIASTGGILLFAGIRFFLAGVMVVAFASFQKRTFLKPAKTDLLPIAVLALLQTFGQYLFYYLGAAHASGMMVSVLSGTSALLALLFSAWVFRLEKMTAIKLAGCLLGFFGILIMNLNGTGFTFTASGEGMVLASQICSALSAVCIQIFSRKSSPVLLSGWQFMLGGAALSLAGLCFADHAIAWNGTGIGILLLLAFVSAGAYTLWGVLLSKWPVSSVGIFGCTIGLFGVLFSALLLHESLSWQIAAGALLMSLGILLVNLRKKAGRSKP